MQITETGTYSAEAHGERMDIEVYSHPVKGLCVWILDYAPGGIDTPVTTNGDGHVPVAYSGLTFHQKVT